jgi:hypothetical protein
MASPRWQSPQTIRRQRLDAAERAFLNIRCAVFTPPLFTRNSRFPSRTLPPPGLRGCNLDATDAKVFMVINTFLLSRHAALAYLWGFSQAGDKVRVRRLIIDGERSTWSEWQRGQVIGYVPMRVYVSHSSDYFLGLTSYSFLVGQFCA